MKRTTLSITIALLLLITAAWAVAAQTAGQGGFDPFAIHITHQEPVTVVATSTTTAGEVITITTPITVGVDLRIDITGPSLASVASDGATASDVQVIVATPQPAPAGADGYQDAAGRIYTVTPNEDIALGQVQSKETALGTQIIGQLTNATDDAQSYIQITIQLLDETGTLIDIMTTYADAEDLGPGETTSFNAIGTTEYADVASYIIEVQ